MVQDLSNVTHGDKEGIEERIRREEVQPHGGRRRKHNSSRHITPFRQSMGRHGFVSIKMASQEVIFRGLYQED